MTDPEDLTKIQNSKYEKLEKAFNIFQKNFTKDSPPAYFIITGEKLALKKIYEIESINDKPISMIAVTRLQYDINNFPKYENYVKNTLGFSRIYYGLWPDHENIDEKTGQNKVERDVLYAISTDDNEEIQNHLNKHNDMNQGNPQMTALIINSDGNYTTVNNSH